MALSRQQTKEWIFDYIAEQFEKTGELIAVTIDEISEKIDTRPKRVQSLLNEMKSEGVIYGDSQDLYRLTPSAFDELLDGLERMNRLPDGFNRDTDTPDFPDAPFDAYQMMAHMQTSLEKQTRAFNESEALELMEQLGKAKDNKDDEEFKRISGELETMGCTVRLKPNNEFSILFPPEMG